MPIKVIKQKRLSAKKSKKFINLIIKNILGSKFPVTYYFCQAKYPDSAGSVFTPIEIKLPEK